MHQCMLYGRLPAGLAYIEQVLGDPLNLPKPREVAERVHFTNEQREPNKLFTIPPIDMTKAQLAKQRREKDKQRKMMARRKASAQTREIYLASSQARSARPSHGRSRGSVGALGSDARRKPTLRLGPSEQPR